MSELNIGVTTLSIILLIIFLALVQVNLYSLQNSFALSINPMSDKGLSIRPVQFGAPPRFFDSSSFKGTCTLSHDATELKGTPQQMEGPYFVDEMPNRSDIRSDTKDGLERKGVPLHLKIHVYNVVNGLCVPLEGAKVDIWHTDSQGIYSAVSDMGTAGSDFLRGFQITNKIGSVEFMTIFPGWYEGRTIHIHDKVRMLNGLQTKLEWTSQLYFNNSINQQIHQQPPYSNHGSPQTTNEEDIIYGRASIDGLIERNSGDKLLVNLTGDGPGYVGEFNIVLNADKR